MIKYKSIGTNQYGGVIFDICICKKLIFATSLYFFVCDAFAQADSTNLPGLSTSAQNLNNTSSGSGVPDPAALSPSTTYTETMVQACPGSGGNGYGYYPNGAVPADGTNVAGQTVNGGVVYDQTVTTDRFGTTTYSGWNQVNFLCTAIPTPPSCSGGQVQTAAPYWDWGSESWQGLQCMNPTPSPNIALEQQACAQYGYNIGLTGLGNYYFPPSTYSYTGQDSYSNQYNAISYMVNTNVPAANIQYQNEQIACGNRNPGILMENSAIYSILTPSNPNQSYDIYTFSAGGSVPNAAQTLQANPNAISYFNECFVQTGTSNVVGFLEGGGAQQCSTQETNLYHTF